MKLRTAIVFDLHKQLPGKMKQYSEKENVEFLQKLNPWKSKKILKKRYSKNCSWRKKKGAESLENYENRKKTAEISTKKCRPPFLLKIQNFVNMYFAEFWEILQKCELF